MIFQNLLKTMTAECFPFRRLIHAKIRPTLQNLPLNTIFKFFIVNNKII